MGCSLRSDASEVNCVQSMSAGMPDLLLQHEKRRNRAETVHKRAGELWTLGRVAFENVTCSLKTTGCKRCAFLPLCCTQAVQVLLPAAAPRGMVAYRMPACAYVRKEWLGAAPSRRIAQVITLHGYPDGLTPLLMGCLDVHVRGAKRARGSSTVIPCSEMRLGSRTARSRHDD